jgi:hypothetical protein
MSNASTVFVTAMYDPFVPCSMATDDDFGPVVKSCLRSFDFTLLFEESALTILPLGIASTFFLVAYSLLLSI